MPNEVAQEGARDYWAGRAAVLRSLQGRTQAVTGMGIAAWHLAGCPGRPNLLHLLTPGGQPEEQTTDNSRCALLMAGTSRG